MGVQGNDKITPKKRLIAMKKLVYWLVSGEGENGTWERVVTTPRGIKLRLTRERCGGDRWARAYSEFFIAADNLVAGYNVESNELSVLPDVVRSDVA